MCDEPIPYSTRVYSATVTLLQFKDLIVKKGCFRSVFIGHMYYCALTGYTSSIST